MPLSREQMFLEEVNKKQTKTLKNKLNQRLTEVKRLIKANGERHWGVISLDSRANDPRKLIFMA
jgi:hypothetical protein